MTNNAKTCLLALLTLALATVLAASYHRPTGNTMALCLVALAGWLGGRRMEQVKNGRRKELDSESSARSLYEFLHDLNQARDIGKGGIGQALAKVERVFQARGQILLPAAEGQGLVANTPAATPLSDRDRVAAEWAWRHRAWAGKHTGNVPDADATCLPLLSGDRSRGVLALQMAREQTLSPIKRQVLESVARLLTHILDSEDTARKARDAEIVMESQKMQRALVDNFSHEIHTPLSVVAGAIQHLRQAARPGDEQDVLREASIAIDRLSLVVSEMTDLAQLECGTLRPSLEWCDSSDFLQEWLEEKTDARAAQPVTLTLTERPVYIRVDVNLLTTALSNLLHNALRHAPRGTPVTVTAALAESRLRISVADRGPGIPPDQQERIFERFYRGRNAAAGGLGLGLPIARQFVELLGGTLTAASAPDGGAAFTIALPYVTELPLAARAAT